MRIPVMLSSLALFCVCIAIKAAKPTVRQQILMASDQTKYRIFFSDSVMFVFTSSKIDTAYFLELADIGDCNSVIFSKGDCRVKKNLR